MPRREAIGLAAVTALAALLRFSTLDLQGYWYDEAVTVELVGLALGDMLSEIPDSESTPPLYYVVAWLWTQAFGTGEVGLRSLSALCGTAAVPVAYAAARELCGARVALATGALAAVSPFLVWYSQEARSYALLTLLGALSLWLLVRTLNRPSAHRALLWALASAAALATHYFAAFLILPEVLWLLAAAPRRQALTGGAVVVVVGLGLLPLALDQRGAGYASFIADDPLPKRVALGVKQLLLSFDSPLEPLTAAAAALIAAAGILFALTRAEGSNRRGVQIAGSIGAASFLVPCLLAVVGLDYVLSRNLIVAWVPLAIVVSAGLTSAAVRRLGQPALAVLAGFALVSTLGVAAEPAWQREDWRGAAETLAQGDPRAILVREPSHARALRLYLADARPASPAPHRVAEVVAIARRGRDLGDVVPTPPDPAALRALGLREAGRRREATYELVRLVPVAGEASLTPAQLMTVRLARERGPSAVLVAP